jgi:hypothetical protein
MLVREQDRFDAGVTGAGNRDPAQRLARRYPDVEQHGTATRLHEGRVAGRAGGEND